MFQNKVIGKLGEDIAANHLQVNGYKILQRNFRTRFGEIDIVAQDGKYVVFVEVKTRRGLKFGYPREAVDQFKQSRIKNMSTLYLAKKKLLEALVRFDVVEIIIDESNNIKSLLLIKNAFE
jgi:putative endonuclease